MNLQTKFTHFLLKTVHAKKIATKGFLKPKRSKKFHYPNRLRRGIVTDQFLVNHRNVVTFKPTNHVENKHIFFLHGGAYTMEAISGHWWMIEQLVKKYAYKLSFIDYPLTPERTYKGAHAMVYQAYATLVENHPKDDFYLLGDSAGGGFCLSFAQSLRNRGFSKRPEKIVLLSPWVDISNSNPEIQKLEKKDLLLDPKELLICSQWFAGDLDLKDPILSPLFGTMEDLHSIGIFVGTHEVLLPDCRELKKKIEASNTSLFYKEYEAMQHDWMIFPIRERMILLKDVVDYLTSTSEGSRA